LLDFFEILVNPRDLDGLVKFYFVWVVGLFAINYCSDHWSTKTAKRSLGNLQEKVGELYSAATVTSSLLLCSMMWNGFKTHPLFDSDAIYGPLVISALSGLLVGVSGLALKVTSTNSSPTPIL
jgi:hypothetical protein